MGKTETAPAENRGGRTPDESSVTMTELVLPADTNLLGNMLGGRLMHLMDIAGALTCRRHSGKEVATVAVDSIEFRHPLNLGEIVTITSRMIWAGRTSMKVRLEVGAEDPRRHISHLTNTAFFTYVALDDNGHPSATPPLQPQTDADRAAFDREEALYLQRRKV